MPSHPSILLGINFSIPYFGIMSKVFTLGSLWKLLMQVLTVYDSVCEVVNVALAKSGYQ